MLPAQRPILRHEDDARETRSPDRTEARVGDRNLLARRVEARRIVPDDEVGTAAVGAQPHLAWTRYVGMERRHEVEPERRLPLAQHVAFVERHAARAPVELDGALPAIYRGL